MSTELVKYSSDKKKSILRRIRDSNLFKRLKGIKNIEIIIAVGIVAVVILIYLALSLGGSADNEEAASPNTVSVTEASDSITEELQEVLSAIENVGKVRVFISYDGNGKLVTAETTTTYRTANSNTSSGSVAESVQTTSTPTVITQSGGQEAIILEKIPPKIIGVIVVAQGAYDISVRLKLMEAVRAVTNADSDNIRIYTMK